MDTSWKIEKRLTDSLEVDDTDGKKERHANQATIANINFKNMQTMTDRAEAFLSDFSAANA